MSEDLQSRLRRLGVVRGTRNLKSPAAPAGVQRANLPDEFLETAGQDEESRPIEALLPGSRLIETPYGACFTLDKVYPLSYQHGADHLADLGAHLPSAAATICLDERLASLDLHDYLFLDTETTGLSGAGTFAFLVGAAFFDRGLAQDAFVVRQYFLRDHADEAAMLYLLAQLLAEKQALITFNGRSFDLPLLDNRYLMNRLDTLAGDLLERPHLDLLPPSRRLWRSRVGSCALGSLEQQILELQRSHEDVPGWAIPGLYLEYLRSGDARPLLRVFYHNQVDMVSMVTLAARVLRQFSRPAVTDHPLDLLSLARWQSGLGLNEAAEESLRLVLSQDAPLAEYQQALMDLSMLLKRDGRREEALSLWQQSAVTAFDDIAAHVELAKHFEWHDRDLSQARSWTVRALELVDRWPHVDAVPARAELEHRLQRLDQKIDRQPPD